MGWAICQQQVYPLGHSQTYCSIMDSSVPDETVAPIPVKNPLLVLVFSQIAMSLNNIWNHPSNKQNQVHLFPFLHDALHWSVSFLVQYLIRNVINMSATCWQQAQSSKILKRHMCYRHRSFFTNKSCIRGLLWPLIVDEDLICTLKIFKYCRERGKTVSVWIYFSALMRQTSKMSCTCCPPSKGGLPK